MKLLDLFCGAGGASEGYARAGFEVTGIDVKHGKDEANEAMGIDWMIWSELVESIPPAYTHYIGQQLSTEVIHRG